MKKPLVILAVVLIGLFSIGLLKDQIIKAAVTVAATKITGAPVHIDGFSLGILSSTVRISGFKIYNPPGFPGDILVDLPKINVTCDLGALIKGRLHLPNAEIELKELVLVKNKDGKLNVDALKVVKQKEKKAARPSREMPMQIDTLKLGIGRIISKNYGLGEAPLVAVYDVNINKTYKNITSAQQLTLLVMMEPMKTAGIQGAAIYGVAMVAGVAVLPAGIAATFAGKDSAQQEFAASRDRIYEVSLAVLKAKGRVTSEDKAQGIISGEADSAQITVKIQKRSGNKTGVTVSARKYFLPQPETAGGILYEISEKLR